MIRNSNVIEIDVFKVMKLSQRLGDFVTGRISQTNQRLTNWQILLVRNRLCFSKLLQGNDSSGEQEVGIVTHRSIHGAAQKNGRAGNG